MSNPFRDIKLRIPVRSTYVPAFGDNVTFFDGAWGAEPSCLEAFRIWLAGSRFNEGWHSFEEINASIGQSQNPPERYLVMYFLLTLVDLAYLEVRDGVAWRQDYRVIAGKS